jgi:hypothetical protein
MSRAYAGANGAVTDDRPASSGCDNRTSHANRPRYVCDAVARRLQIPSFSPRQLRHTTGTMLHQQTGDSVRARRCSNGLCGHGDSDIRISPWSHSWSARDIASAPGEPVVLRRRRGLGRLHACRCEAIGDANAISCRVNREWAIAARSGVTGASRLRDTHRRRAWGTPQWRGAQAPVRDPQLVGRLGGRCVEKSLQRASP